MIIILEGPDGLGKTKLITDLLSYDKSYKLISTARQSNVDETLPEHLRFDKTLANLPKEGLHLLDRHCSSDIAYSIYRASVTQRNIEAVRERFKRLAKAQLVIYIQLMPTKTHFNMKLGYEEYSKKQYRKLIDAYYTTFLQIGTLQSAKLITKLVMLDEPGQFTAQDVNKLCLNVTNVIN